MVYQCPTVRPFHMSRSNLRTPLPIHFKFHRVIGIDGLIVCGIYSTLRKCPADVVNYKKIKLHVNVTWYFTVC
jgi:hypothetical protein